LYSLDIEITIAKMKNSKTPGVDKIEVYVIQTEEPIRMQVIYKIMRMIWQ
jgi:hypothetical protein